MNIYPRRTLPYAGMVAVMVVVGYFARQNHRDFEKSIVDRSRWQLLDTVHSEARALNGDIYNLTRELEILSEEELVQDVFLHRGRELKETIVSLLDDSYKDVKSLADSLLMIDTRGVVIGESPLKNHTGKDFSTEADVRKALISHHAQASGIISTAPGEAVLTFEQPVFSRDRFVGLLRAVIRLDTIQAIVNRHEQSDRYSFLLNQENLLLSYPDRRYVGKNVSALFQGNGLSLASSRFEKLLSGMTRGKEGSGTCQLLTPDSPHGMEEVIVAFSPVFFGERQWTLVEVIDYDAIAGLVDKNAKRNLLFAGLIILVLFLSAFAFYRDQKIKNKELRRLYGNLERNLKELKSTQGLLIQAAKMESVGKLAAGVAHEVKNPLAVILLGVRYLKDNVASHDELVPAFLDDMATAVGRADAIVKGLLDFAFISELEIRPQDMHALIERVLLLVNPVLKVGSVFVTREFEKALPAVSGDKNRIEQVFVNLFVNAIQAMPSGGELCIRTCREKSDDGKSWVVVRVEDSGPGMSESVLKDLFVPFVTTKRGAGGTGLGLSIIKNIMDNHGGKVTLENKTTGRGAVATLWFRISEGGFYEQEKNTGG